MKPIETKKNPHKRQSLIMIACFLYGGFAILLFALDIYSAIWFGSTFTGGGFGSARAFDQNELVPRDFNHGGAPPQPVLGPLRIITSPLSILILASGIISIIAGYTIYSMIREQEVKRIKQETADYLLMPDEKKVIEILKRSEAALTQSKITKDSGLTKVQVHRVIKRLETKGLVEKHRYGLTNKIVLKRELFE